MYHNSIVLLVTLYWLFLGSNLLTMETFTYAYHVVLWVCKGGPGIPKSQFQMGSNPKSQFQMGSNPKSQFLMGSNPIWVISKECQNPNFTVALLKSQFHMFQSGWNPKIPISNVWNPKIPNCLTHP